MTTELFKIDLTYIGPESMIIYPLYSKTGEKIIDARTPLSVEKINNIIDKYGKIVYYSFSDEMKSIPNHRIYSALNKSKEIMDEVLKSDKISKIRYKESEELMEQLLNDVLTADTDTIKLLKDLKSFDDYTYNHSVNVLLLTSIFSYKLNMFTTEELKYILLGAFLHDIGKMKIDRQLLNKKGKLTATEFQKVKRHPQLGYEMLKGIETSNKIVLQCLLFHHEKFNTKGYYGLPYEHLPFFPKIVSICDVFDALTSRRPYRAASSPAAALKIILNSIDNHFDYDLISKFINIIGPIVNNTKYFYGKDEICELNTNELALIVKLGSIDILKPEVVVFCKVQKAKSKINVKFYDKPFRVNLMEDISRIMTNVLSNEYQVNSIKNRLLERCLSILNEKDPYLSSADKLAIN